jgi:hypothetical protein
MLTLDKHDYYTLHIAIQNHGCCQGSFQEKTARKIADELKLKLFSVFLQAPGYSG